MRTKCRLDRLSPKIEDSCVVRLGSADGIIKGGMTRAGSRTPRPNHITSKNADSVTTGSRARFVPLNPPPLNIGAVRCFLLQIQPRIEKGKKLGQLLANFDIEGLGGHRIAPGQTNDG